MIGKAYRPLWVSAATDTGPIWAITFVADRQSHRYAGEIPETLAARYIASACGHVGSNAEYLLETFRHCEQCGIEDPMLSRLQALVAAELTRNRQAT
jgi:cation transport protein ChaC